MAMPDNQPPYRHERNSGWWEIKITPKEVYDSVQKLKGSIDAALQEFAVVNRRIDIAEREHEKDHMDHEERIRALEKTRWPLASVTVVLSAGAFLLMLLSLLSKPN